MPFSLDGEIALITGGGTGLGLGIARCMVASGAKVILTGRRREPLEVAAQELGSAAICHVHDVSDFAAAPGLVAEVTAAVGTPTILVNNAGNHLKKPAVETSEEEFLKVINVHMTGALALTRAAAPAMLAAGRGSVLFIASMASYLAIPSIIAYTAAKAGVLGMVNALNAEFAPRGVRVNAIVPGWILSDTMQNAIKGDAAREQKIISRIPLGRIGDPADIGWAAVYLCSREAAYVSGVALPIDGGALHGF